MSSKGTIILSAANEHWYHDCNENFDITLELNKEHEIQIDDEGAFITIKHGTALHDAIMQKSWPRG